MTTVAPVVHSNPSYSNSGYYNCGDVPEGSNDTDDSFEDSDKNIDAESLVGSDNDSIASSPDIPNPSQYVPSSPNSQNMGKCTLSHYSSNFDDGTLDGSSTDTSD